MDHECVAGVYFFDLGHPQDFPSPTYMSKGNLVHCWIASRMIFYPITL